MRIGNDISEGEGVTLVKERRKGKGKYIIFQVYTQ